MMTGVPDIGQEMLESKICPKIVEQFWTSQFGKIKPYKI
jgi:hypothetical protein